MLLFRYTMIVPLFRCWIVVSRKFVAQSRSSWVVLVAIVCVLGKLLKIKVYLKYVQLLLNKAKHRDKEVLIVVQTTKHTHLPCCVQTVVVVAVVFVAVVPADQPAAAHAPRSADPAGARFPQSADHPEPHAS